MSYSIPISGLNEITIISSDDFFPIVDSSSLTTFRVSVNNLGNYLAPASTPWASRSLFADSSSWSSQSLVSVSSSWASRSLQALYAMTSSYIDLIGDDGYFPYWNMVQDTNANLKTNSQLWQQNTAEGNVVFVNSASSTLADYIPWPVERPDLSESQYNPKANQMFSYAWPYAQGINTVWPIISQNFVGTDMVWYGWTHNWPPTPFYGSQSFVRDYFSGSSGPTSGSWEQFNNATDKLSNVLNGKWLRIASLSSNGGYTGPGSGKPAADHTAMGEIRSAGGDGLIKLQIGTPSGPGDETNVQHVIYIYICTQVYSGYMTAHVYHSSMYNGSQLIKQIRMFQGPSDDTVDSGTSLDIMLDNISDDDDHILIEGKSWGGLRFLKYINVDPWPPEFTGSNDIKLSPTTLIFPAAPGIYSNAPKNQNYYIQGQNVVIWPTPNEITQSGYWNPSNISSYSLYASGTINTNCYYCGDHQGLTTKLTISGVDMYFSGGILVSGVGGGGGPPTPPSDLLIGSMVVWPSQTIPINWMICSGSILPTASYLDLYNAIKTTSTFSSFGRRCTYTGAPSSIGTYFKVPNMKGCFAKGWDGITNTFGAASAVGGSTSTSHTHGYTDWASGVLGNGGVLISKTTDGSSVTVPSSTPANVQINWIIKYA